jgi:hypothetical protein
MMNIECPIFWRVGLLAQKTQRFQIWILLVALPRGDDADQEKPLKHLPICACLLGQ